MKIAVKSFYKAQDSIDRNEFDYVISLIAHEGDDRCPCRGDHHLVLQFDDAEVDKVFHEGQWWYGPSRQHVRDILAWARQIPEDKTLLVHCTAGKSRSTAVAVIVLVQAGETPEDAIQQVLEARIAEGSDIVIPNRLLIGLADEELQLDGALNAAIDQHYRNVDRLGRVPLALLNLARHTPEA